MNPRRTRLLVADFQRNAVKRILSYCLVYHLTVVHVMFCWELIQQGRGNLLEQYLNFLVSSTPMWVCFLLLAPAVAWDTVRASHRVAGPLVRFRHVFQAIAAGNVVKPIQLREGDELQDLAEDLNAMLNAINRSRSDDESVTLLPLQVERKSG